MSKRTDKIKQLNKYIKILRSKHFLKCYKLAEKISNFRIEDDFGFINIWFDSIPSKDMVVFALREYAKLGFRNRDENFKIDLNDIDTGYFAWYLVRKDNEYIKVNLLLPSKNTKCKRIFIKNELREIPIYKTVCF